MSHKLVAPWQALTPVPVKGGRQAQALGLKKILPSQRCGPAGFPWQIRGSARLYLRAWPNIFPAAFFDQARRTDAASSQMQKFFLYTRCIFMLIYRFLGEIVTAP
ncbi:MAG: hypothetical protein DI595_21175 [Agrobacterium fabrum]|uniref:Uncharacterized protein n=1 Tax=Agrobacterium fabrum TaxID=1176649 RepID=A0A2W5ELY6_9HYPH|nr:MAG: hypothetical protein DI595_21175 [Agrobacterium fabrum]